MTTGLAMMFKTFDRLMIRQSVHLSMVVFRRLKVQTPKWILSC